MKDQQALEVLDNTIKQLQVTRDMLISALSVVRQSFDSPSNEAIATLQKLLKKKEDE